MSQFTDFVSIRPLPKNDKWITTKEFTFYISDDELGESYTVPCGFVFDGCSVFCPFGQSIESKTITSCCLHDYLFRNKQGFWISNLCLYRGMRANGIGRFKRIKYLVGVTLFGWFIYFEIIKRIKKLYDKMKK